MSYGSPTSNSTNRSMMRVEPIDRRRAALIAFIVAAAVYVNSLPNGFAYDDVFIIQNNERVHRIGDLGGIWSTPYWPFAGEVLGLYRPLTIFSYAVQWAISDGAPWLFHLSNVLLHGLVTVLVFYVVAHGTGTVAALAGALVFAVHPVHTEAVANVVGHAELLAAAFVLAGCLIYLRADAEKGLSRKRLGAIVAFYALGMLTKESAVVLPGLLVLLDLARRRIELTGRGVARYAKAMAVPIATLAATLLAYLVLRLEILGSIGGSDANPGLPFLREDRRVLSALRAWPEFARLLFFPMDLSADYSPAVILPVESWTPMALLGAALLAATVVMMLAVPRYPAAGTAAGWFFISILPVSNLLFPIGVLVAERTLYLPSVMVSYLVAGAWQAVAAEGTRRARQLGAAAVAAVLVLFAARTIIRNPEWEDTDSIFDALYRDHPESYRAQLQLAVAKMQQGDTVGSQEHWELAYRLWPRDPGLLVQYGLANYVWKRYDRAIELFEEADSIHPGYAEAKPFLGMSYVHTGRFEDAIALTDRLFPKLGPNRLLFDIRGRAYAELGNDTLAVTSFRAATRQPGGDNWALWTLLARSLARLGNEAEAEKALQTARDRAAGDTALLRRIDEVLAGTAGVGEVTDSASVLQNAIGTATFQR